MRRDQAVLRHWLAKGAVMLAVLIVGAAVSFMALVLTALCQMGGDDCGGGALVGWASAAATVGALVLIARRWRPPS